MMYCVIWNINVQLIKFKADLNSNHYKNKLIDESAHGHRWVKYSVISVLRVPGVEVGTLPLW